MRVLSAEPASLRPKLPELISVSSELNRCVFDLRIPADLAYFPGHFPVRSILPGVVQIDWAIHFARQYFALGGEFSKMEVLKFQQIIVPGNQLKLSLEYRADNGKLYFDYSNAEHKFSSGRLVFSQ